MPSPIGHSLAGAIIGVLLRLDAAPLRSLLQQALRQWKFFAAAILLANVPDLDYVVSWVVHRDWNLWHHEHTHTLLFGFLLSAACSGLLLARGNRSRAWYAMVWLAPLSHMLLDPCSQDFSEPRGIMLLWPISDMRFILPDPIFLNLEKRTWADVWQWHNLKAFALEFAYVAPVLVFAVAYKGFRGCRKSN